MPKITWSNISSFPQSQWEKFPSIVILILFWLSTGSVVEQAWGNENEIQCKGILGALVIDQVRVPRGFTCHLNGTRVNGSIIIEPKATLQTTGANLNGDIRAYPGHRIQLDSQTKLRGTLYDARNNQPLYQWHR